MDEELQAVHKGKGGVFEDEFLTLEEAATILDMGVERVRRALARGELSCEDCYPDNLLARDVLAFGIRQGNESILMVGRLRDVHPDASFGEIFRWFLLGLDLAWMLEPSEDDHKIMQLQDL